MVEEMKKEVELLKWMQDNAKELILSFSKRDDMENKIIELLGFCDIIDTWIDGLENE